MWKMLPNKSFLIVTDELEVFVTDFVTIYYTNFTEASFLACLKDSNVGLEMDEKALIDAGNRMLTKPEELKTVTILKENKTLIVMLFTIHCGLPLKLILKLTEGSKELFFQKVTRVLLQVTQDYRCSQQELRRELVKKDEEIEEYKCEGGEIALRHLKTVPFNEQEHLNSHSAFISHFGNTDDFKTLLQKSVDIPEMNKTEGKQEASEITENGSTVKIGAQDTVGIMKKKSGLQTKQNVKEATSIVKVETNIPETDEPNGRKPKIETEDVVKIENVKLEQPNSRTSRPMVSPPKRKRSRLNY